MTNIEELSKKVCSVVGRGGFDVGSLFYFFIIKITGKKNRVHYLLNHGPHVQFELS